MSTKTGLGPAVFIAVLVVAAAALYAVKKPNTDNDNKDREDLVLTASWTPAARPLAHGVTIRVSVAGKQIFSDIAHTSPWHREVNVPKGVQVLLFVSQGNYPLGEVGCIIERGLVEIDQKGPSRETSVNCWSNKGKGI